MKDSDSIDPATEHSDWSTRANRVGRDVVHALEPWRKLPWPKKWTLPTAVGVLATWVTGVYEYLPWF